MGAERGFGVGWGGGGRRMMLACEWAFPTRQWACLQPAHCGRVFTAECRPRAPLKASGRDVGQRLSRRLEGMWVSAFQGD